MIKKIIATVFAALFFTGACVTGFLYSGLDPSIPAVESKTAVASPEKLGEYCKALPTGFDYYLGRVISGKFDEEPFSTLTAYIHGKNQYTSGSGDNSECEYTAMVLYGSDAMRYSVKRYCVSEEKTIFNDTEYTITYLIKSECDFYIGENRLYFRARKYDFNYSVLPAVIEENAVTTYCEEEKAIAQALQLHLNEWIDVSGKSESMPESDLYSIYYQSELEAQSICLDAMYNFTAESNFLLYVSAAIDNYLSEKNKWEQYGDIYSHTDSSDSDNPYSVVINMSLNTAPDVTINQTNSNSSYTSTSETFFTLYAFDNTKVDIPKKPVDPYYVFSQYFNLKEEE